MKKKNINKKKLYAILGTIGVAVLCVGGVAYNQMNTNDDLKSKTTEVKKETTKSKDKKSDMDDKKSKTKKNELDSSKKSNKKSKDKQVSNKDDKKEKNSSSPTSSKNSSSSKPNSSANTSKPHDTPSSNTNRPSKPKPNHTHKWVEQFTTVNHKEEGHYENVLVSDAWTEYKPIYDYVMRDICNTCGADITGAASSHIEQHMLNGENGSFRQQEIQMQVGTQEVHHDAVYNKQWVVDKAAWSEKASNGYRCECGAVK